MNGMKKEITIITVAITLSAIFSMSFNALAQAGSLDFTFDSDGTVTTPIGASQDYAQSVAVQNDGKIVVAGYSGNGVNFDFALARYNTDGSLDTSFDTDGIVTTPIGTSDDFILSVAIQTDGKIVAAGYFTNSSNNYDWALVRYNNDGSLDLTFDADGIVTTAVGSSDDYAYSLAIQSDGKIVVIGYTKIGVNPDVTLARYNADGSLDSTFDTDGIVTTAIGASIDVVRSIALQSDGKIVVTGYTLDTVFTNIALLRYNTDGSLDSSFDSDGIVTTSIPNSTTYGLSVALQSDGKIVVAGEMINSTDQDFVVVRYNTNGSLDNTFNTDGIVTTAVGSSTDIGNAIAIQSDGKIVVAGSTVNPDFALVRYDTSGNLDNTFDTDGIVATSVGTEGDEGSAMAIQSDGKIIVAGYSKSANNYNFALARYNIANTIDINGIESQINELKIYPNPFSSFTTLNTDVILRDASLTIYDIYGQQISRINNISSGIIIFHRDNLPGGIYFAQLIQDNISIAISKLVITYQ
jgi:uncharacterized delta-60 repeat protein